MSSEEGYFITLAKAGIPLPVIDNTSSQAELWKDSNPHLFMGAEEVYTAPAAGKGDGYVHKKQRLLDV